MERGWGNWGGGGGVGGRRGEAGGGRGKDEKAPLHYALIVFANSRPFQSLFRHFLMNAQLPKD